MNIEDYYFSRARLGRYWTPETAVICVRYFPAPYRFDPQMERAFIATHQTDYNDNLRGQLERNLFDRAA